MWKTKIIILCQSRSAWLVLLLKFAFTAQIISDQPIRRGFAHVLSTIFEEIFGADIPLSLFIYYHTYGANIMPRTAFFHIEPDLSTYDKRQTLETAGRTERTNHII